MNLFREGIEYKNQLIWQDVGSNYHLCFANGTFDPLVTNAEEVFNSEVNTIRVEINTGDKSVTWNETSNIDEVSINKNFTPNEDLRFNRIFILKGGRERAKYLVSFTGFNTFTVTSPTLAPFLIEDRLFYAGYFYEVIDVDGLDITVDPYPSAPDLPNSGSDYISDAEGVLLVGSILENLYLAETGIEINILVKGSTV